MGGLDGGEWAMRGDGRLDREGEGEGGVLTYEAGRWEEKWYK